MHSICLTNDGKQEWTLDANEAEIIETGAGSCVTPTVGVCIMAVT